MKLRHFLPNYQLDEVRMSPSALQKFANSPEAEGIIAGFEAELIFSNATEDSPGDRYYPDWEVDEPVSSISDILEFFSNNEDGFGIDRQEYAELKQKLTHEYKSWAANEQSDTHQHSEHAWLRDIGIEYASDAYTEFDLRWPLVIDNDDDSGEFNNDVAQKYADDLSDELGIKTIVSDRYHGADRDSETWIFEPDSSIRPDSNTDMPVEIVSPPMPLNVCLARMAEFFNWANEKNAYANTSTGFHMSVSLPNLGGDVDYIKLALFLGDEHVLQEFGRSFNSYTKSAMKRIRERVNLGAVYIPDAFDLMKKGLVDLAYSVIMKDNTFDKYSSINPHNTAYVEFRSAGNKDYFHDIKKLQNTLLRYALAMSIAGNPQAERQEYYKKLYKLVSVNTGDTSIDLFSKYASGNITRDELIKKWTNLVLRSGSTSAQRAAAAKRISSKQPAGAESASRSSSPQQRFTGTWRVILGGEEVTTVPGATQGLANAAAMIWIRNQGPEFLSSRNTQEVEVYPIYR